MKKQKIFFRPVSEMLSKITPAPSSAVSLIPKWFKDIPRYVNNAVGPNGKNDFFNTKSVKTCIPFFDSITCGYLYLLPFDLYCSFDENGNRQFNWNRELNMNYIGSHDNLQVGEYPILEEYDKQIFKLHTTWGVQTPSNYSLLYMHPLGRFDLPFYSFHGLVDSDLFSKQMNIPFIVKKGFEGLIPQGTPVSQIIPIKRDKWESKTKKYNEDGYDLSIDTLKVSTYMEKWYKKNIWVKKEYN